MTSGKGFAYLQVWASQRKLQTTHDPADADAARHASRALRSERSEGRGQLSCWTAGIVFPLAAKISDSLLEV
jgi:hypothetical protein